MTSDNATTTSVHGTDLVLSQAEMTDGITTTERLEEIISAIKANDPCSSVEGKPRPNPDCNGDLAHWYSLVHAVSATSDEECIKHFVEKLDGLALIADWAHTAQKLGNEVTVTDGNDSPSEKLIVSLLNLLNKLQIETYMLSDGGMVNVLKELGTGKSSLIKEMALALHDKWRPAEVGAGSSCELTNSKIPETSESINEANKPDQNASGSYLKRQNVEEQEKEEDAEEQMDNTSDPVSPASSSDTGSMPEMKSLMSPTEKEKKAKTVYDDDDMDAILQVAIQVEEEVVQYRETLCSSPEEETQQEADFPLTTSTEGKSDQNTVDRVCSIPSFREEDSVLTTGTHEEGLVKASKADGCGFDLNNLCVDYETMPELIHVAASKGIPPSSSIPASSCRFGAGTAVGWTGTAAATSAFRPASPRSGLHSSADRSVTATPVVDSVGQKEKSSSCLAFEFDLNNVAEMNTAEVTLPPSGNSSTEVSSDRAKRLKLDLNFTDGDEVAEPISAQLSHKHIPSHVFRDHGNSSSSSSLRNQAKFDFDLNDDPSSRKDERQTGNSVKLMGWNMNGGTVPQNQTTPPMFHSFLGPNAAPSQFGSLSGPTNLYQSHMIPSSSYGYQYMAPQVWFGQPSTSYAVQPHFVPQMMGPVSENGPSIGLSLMPGDRSNFFRPNLDLNASTGSMEATSREVGFRQFLVQNHSVSVQEPVLNATAQPTVQTPGNGVRWREQEREREAFSYGFKQLI